MSPQTQAILAGVALVILGVLTACLIFVPVPQGNQQLVTFALGALSGALTVSGAARVADKIGGGVTFQSSPSQEQQP